MSTNERAAALPDFKDPRVQAVYEIICDDTSPPEGEHWDGFVSRRIVAALAAAPVSERAANEEEHPAASAMRSQHYADGYTDGLNAGRAESAPSSGGEAKAGEREALLASHIELNMGNYNSDDVDALNAWALEAYDFISRAPSLSSHEALQAIVHARDSGQDATLILDENSPLIDAARTALTSEICVEPVGEVLLIARDCKEVAWRKGKMPPVGAKLYMLASAQQSDAPSFESMKRMFGAACADLGAISKALAADQSGDAE